MSRKKLAAAANIHLDRTQEISEDALVLIERGRRRIRLNEALALCAALDVAPVNMFFPLERTPAVRFGEGTRVHLRSPARMREWLVGKKTLEIAEGERWARFLFDEVPEPLKSERLKKLDTWSTPLNDEAKEEWQ